MKRALCTFAVLVTTSGCIFSGGQTPIDPGSDTGEDPVNLDAGADASDATASNNGVPDANVIPDAAPGDSGSDASRDLGADAAPDADQPAVCGDGFVTGDETCDPATSRGCPADAATDCDQVDACLPFEVVGDPSTCSSECVALPEVTVCLDGDGCCPSGCDETGDDDCAAFCGNNVQETGEICDGNCPADCSDGNSCTTDTMTGSAGTCDAECTNDVIVACVDGDGCCPGTCNQSNDDDCSATCGDNVLDPGETCDGDCPTDCPLPSDACERHDYIGSPTNCTAECVTRTIDLCINADGCCPTGCNANNDNDCDAVCGNGIKENPEVCDSNCPVSCNDGNACTVDSTTGSAGSCDLICVNTAITQCVNGDGCCAPGCHANNDTDCNPICGNSVTESGEDCDGDCPSNCNDGLACTTDTLSGTPGQCNVTCTNSPISSCGASDGCCPGTCNSNNDPDCAAVCGNGVTEPGETCDGDCMTSCDDNNACTIETMVGSAGTCDVACTSSVILICSNTSDGCCPAGCTSTNDVDCEPTCGNGVREKGEECDGSVGNQTCLNASLSYAGGTLACDNTTCRFDTSGCHTKTPGTEHHAFVTSARFYGNQIGGVARADNLCNTAAEGSVAEGYSYVALLADSYLNIDLSDRLIWGTTVKNMLGQTVRSNTTWPWSSLSNPIRYDQNAVDLDPLASGTHGQIKAWTGANTSGVASGQDCRDISNAAWRGRISSPDSNSGDAGRIAYTDTRWMDGGGLDGCDTSQHRLYCVSARSQPNVFVFATSAKFTGGQIGGVSGADQLCKQAAAANGSKTAGLNRDWFAMLSTPTITPRYRSSWDSADFGVRPIYNVNGDLVESAADSWPWTLESPVMYDEDGNALDATRVWSGGISGGGAHVDNCNGWTSSSSSDTGFTGRVSATQSWLGDTSVPCNTPLRLFCMSR